MNGPDFSFEKGCLEEGFRVIAGVDEVGRGPLAGPVTAAAVILDQEAIPLGLNDSKALSATKRERLYEEICAGSQVSVVHVSVEEIDRLNILQASLKAMRLALQGLGDHVDMALIDGNKIPTDLPHAAQAIVKGDARSLSIAAASIVAKPVRDRLMCELERECPGYGWCKNAGYPTKAHLEALEALGVSTHHRRSFKPVYNILYQEN